MRSFIVGVLMCGAFFLSGCSSDVSDRVLTIEIDKDRGFIHPIRVGMKTVQLSMDGKHSVAIVLVNQTQFPITVDVVFGDSHVQATLAGGDYILADTPYLGAGSYTVTYQVFFNGDKLYEAKERMVITDEDAAYITKFFASFESFQKSAHEKARRRLNEVGVQLE